jgi:uncharacterized damage-inducible protein DinB
METKTAPMKLATTFLNELKHEAATTRKILALVPTDKLTWKPHEKSMHMHSLAKHLAELPTWVGITLNHDELDFAKPYPKSPDFTTTAELLAMFEKHIPDAIKVLETVKDEEFGKNWTLRHGEKIFFTMPKAAVLRNFVFNHVVHHRAQLGVYLRMLDVPLPGSYGPTADDAKM